MAKTFLELVNDAIYESKITLDPLDSTNFASPPRTTMYNRFKNWVNMAYKELLMKRNEWFFRVERATVDVWPRIHIAGLSVGFTPAVDDVLVGDSSGVQFTVKGVHSFEDIEGDTDTEYTLSVVANDGYDLRNLILKETFSRTSPTTDSAACNLKGLGQYSFTDLVTNLESIDMDTVRASKIPTDAATEGLTFATNDSKVTYVPWSEWHNCIRSYNYTGWLAEMPVYISQTPQGKYELYPQPEGNVQLSFDFTTKISPMVNYDDTPEIVPEQFHEYITWRAVQEYADFDEKPKLFMRAAKHAEEYLSWLNRDEMQRVRIEPSRFYVS